MKTKTCPAGILFTAIVFSIAALTGCSSVGYKTGDRTAASLQHASQAVQAESQALDETIAALANLVNSPAADLKPQFVEYRQSLERLVAAAERTDKAINRLQRTSADYFEAWDAQLAEMNYEVIRSNSEARKLAVSNHVAVVCQRYDDAQAVVKPFISYFNDIQRSLGTDLTVEGLAAAREVVGNAESNTRKVQAALQQLSSELNNSGARLSSVTWSETPLEATGRSESNVTAQAASEMK